MIGFLAPMVTADEVNQGFSDGLWTIVQGTWNILAPFAAAAVVLFVIAVVVKKVAGGHGRR